MRSFAEIPRYLLDLSFNHFSSIDAFVVYLGLLIFLFLLYSVFSKGAVICIVLGVITLLCMIFLAVYKSKQQKKILEGPSKQADGNDDGFIVLLNPSSVRRC